MNSDYVAWNGERYVWPPPEGWYLASDGRWWAPDTGPELDLEPLPSEPAPTAAAEHSIDSGFDAETAEPEDSAPDHEPVDTPPAHDVSPAKQHFPDLEAGPIPDSEWASGQAADLNPAIVYDDSLPESKSESVPYAGTGRPVSDQISAVPDSDATTAMAADLGNSRRNPTMVMTESPHTGTGPHSVVAADPDTGRHDQVPVLEPDEAPSANIGRSRTMPLVAAGLLVAAAIGIAALLSLLGGDDETQTQQPSASADDTTDGSDELVVSTDDAGTPTSADGAMDDGAMDDGAMDDGAMEEDDGAMEEEGDDTTSTTVVDTPVGTDDAALIGQFRTILEENQITAAALTGDDLMVFGETACSYATSAEELPGYEQIRDDALNGAQNDELSIAELQFVVDTAVTVFCAEDATRLGLTATPPPEEG